MKHGITGYNHYRCRCDICCEANRERRRRQGPHKRTPEQKRAEAALAASRQAETAAKAEKRWEPWTGAEIELVMRRDLTAREIALALGRTYMAVVNMRRRIREGDLPSGEEVDR